jgi:hypothetical protein
MLLAILMFQFYKILIFFGVIPKVGENNKTTYGRIILTGNRLENRCLKQVRHATQWLLK